MRYQDLSPKEKKHQDKIFVLKKQLEPVYNSMSAAMESAREKTDVRLWNRLCEYKGLVFDEIFSYNEPDVCQTKYWVDLFLQEIPAPFDKMVVTDPINRYLPERKGCLLESDEMRENHAQYVKGIDVFGFRFKVFRKCEACRLNRKNQNTKYANVDSQEKKCPKESGKQNILCCKDKMKECIEGIALAEKEKTTFDAILKKICANCVKVNIK